MSDSAPPRPDARVFDPNTTPVPRRRMLVLMGVGTLAAAGGLGAVLAGCSSPPVDVTLDVDPASLEPGLPKEVAFTLALADGTSVEGSTWLVERTDGTLVAFDPRCTHALCRYRWSETGFRFRCHCHEGEFALDGTVLGGPPPRPLDRFPIQVVGGHLVVTVPGDFRTPRESLPA